LCTAFEPSQVQLQRIVKVLPLLETNPMATLPSSVSSRPETRAARRPALLAVLLLVWGLLLAAGVTSQVLDLGLMSRIGRLGSSAVLVLAGWVWYAVSAGNQRVKPYPMLIALGMTLGFIGDLFNADLIPIPLPDPVLGGIASFALGHVAYMWGIVTFANKHRICTPSDWLKGIIPWQAVGFLGWLAVAFPAYEKSILVWPALPYSLLLAGTAGCATAMFLGHRKFLGLALGGGLFLLSDLILAFRLFGGDFPMAGEAVWLTYGPGQMLIVYSIGAALWVASQAPSQLPGDRA